MLWLMLLSLAMTVKQPALMGGPVMRSLGKFQRKNPTAGVCILFSFSV